MRGTLPNKTESDKVRIKAKRTKKIETLMNVLFDVYSCCICCSSVLWGVFFYWNAGNVCAGDVCAIEEDSSYFR